MSKLPLLLAIPLLLVSCISRSPQASALPTHQQVAMRYENPTPSQLLNYCNQKGGKYEIWTDKEDGSKHIFCMLPQGYGCDPEQFFKGSCGLE